MDYDLIQNLGCAIDNVYNNISEKPDRRTTTKIINDMLIVEYQTIITIAKDADFKYQMDMIKSESKQMIDKMKGQNRLQHRHDPDQNVVSNNRT